MQFCLSFYVVFTFPFFSILYSFFRLRLLIRLCLKVFKIFHLINIILLYFSSIYQNLLLCYFRGASERHYPYFFLQVFRHLNLHAETKKGKCGLKPSNPQFNPFPTKITLLLYVLGVREQRKESSVGYFDHATDWQTYKFQLWAKFRGTCSSGDFLRLLNNY